MSTRATSPFEEPATLIVPVAGDGATTITDVAGCPTATVGERTEPAKIAQTAQSFLHKAVTSRAEAHVPAYKTPFLR
jgi:hypothetical protein